MKKISVTLAALLLSGLSHAAELNYVSIKGLIEQDVGRELLPQIYQEIGISIDIEPMSGKQAQDEATSGRKDGEIMRIWSYGENNPSTQRVPTPYYSLQTMAFIKKDSVTVINSKEDLGKYKVVKVSGVKHTTNITKGLSNVKDVENTKVMMEQLHDGSADVALTNTIDGVIMLKKLGYTDIVPIDKPLAVLDLYHYIHEDHADMVSKVDGVLKSMKKSGKLANLVGQAENKVIFSYFAQN